MTDIIIILVTAGSEGEAEKIAQTLVEERLAACVNIISPSARFIVGKGKPKMIASGYWSLRQNSNTLPTLKHA